MRVVINSEMDQVSGVTVHTMFEEKYRDARVVKSVVPHLSSHSLGLYVAESLGYS